MEQDEPRHGGVIKTVDIPSMRLARRIAASRPSTRAARAEFARALVDDARTMAAAIVARRPASRP